MIDIPCVIFAGGKSSRMGRDKALLPFGGFDTLTEFQYTKLDKVFKNVYISCRDKKKFKFKANFIEDISKGSVYAPTIGFVTIYETLNCKSFFAIGVDIPFVSKSEILNILKKDKIDADATIAETEFGIQPMCGIYHRTLKNGFIEMLDTDTHKLGILLKNSKTTFVYFKDNISFLNLNNINEYKEALRLVKFRYIS